jgi:putative endonuclease
VQAKDVRGRLGEDLAAAHLVGLGYSVLERNWRCELGELDIVARDGDVLVVCEVKTRSSRRFGDPLEAVTPAKASRLRRLAARWVSTHDVWPREIRIDVVGVLLSGDQPEIDHVRDAVA